MVSALEVQPLKKQLIFVLFLVLDSVRLKKSGLTVPEEVDVVLIAGLRGHFHLLLGIEMVSLLSLYIDEKVSMFSDPIS